MAPRPDPPFRLSGRIAWRVCVPLAHLLGLAFPVRKRGSAIPDGPLVIAANHFSHLDPVLVGMVVQHPTRYLAVDELYGSSRFFDSATQWAGAIPMSRTRAPLGALKTALAELAAGGRVGLFPEGVRVWTWGEVPPKRGAAWLARRADVPLLPIALDGSGQAFGRGTSRISRAPITVTVCEAIHPRDHESAADPLDSMMSTWVERISQALESA